MSAKQGGDGERFYSLYCDPATDETHNLPFSEWTVYH